MSNSHVVTADQLSQAEPTIRRLLAMLVWLFSMYGNVLAFGGDAQGLTGLTGAAWLALLIAIAWQILVSAVQYVTCRRWHNPLYITALLLSVIPAFIGYRPIIATPIATWITGYGDPFASRAVLAAMWQQNTSVVLWFGVVSVALLVALTLADVIPERVFVKH